MDTYDSNEDHRLTVTINADGDIDAQITCSAPLGTRCRLICSEGCEEFTYEDHEHPLVDSGECGLLVYIDGQGEVFESYGGDKQPLRDAPVVLSYYNEYVTWQFAEPLIHHDNEARAEGVEAAKDRLVMRDQFSERTLRILDELAAEIRSLADMKGEGQ